MALYKIFSNLATARLILMKGALDTAADTMLGLEFRVHVEEADHFQAYLGLRGEKDSGVVFTHGMHSRDNSQHLYVEVPDVTKETVQRLMDWVFGVPKIGEQIRQALINDVGPSHYLARNHAELFAALSKNQGYRVFSTVKFPALFMLDSSNRTVKFIDMDRVQQLIKE